MPTEIQSPSQEKETICYRCRKVQPASVRTKIDEIEESPDGFILKGFAHCVNCGQLLQWGQTLRVEFKELKCPNCGKADLNLAFKKITALDGGYFFSALLKCRNQKCNWKKSLKTGLHSTGEMLSSIKKLKISTTGFEIER